MGIDEDGPGVFVVFVVHHWSWGRLGRIDMSWVACEAVVILFVAVMRAQDGLGIGRRTSTERWVNGSSKTRGQFRRPIAGRKLLNHLTYTPNAATRCL